RLNERKGPGQGIRDRPQDTRSRARRQHCRSLGPRQQRDAVERRRVLYHPQGLERARRGRRSHVALQQAQCRSPRNPGGGYPGDAAAADPGHRQRRRLHDAGRDERRQLRHGQAAERHQRHRRERQDAVRAAVGAGLVPCERAAVQARSGSGEDGGAAGLARPGLRRARRLSRIDVCQSVQSVRAGVPGLRAGRLTVPRAARGHRKHVRTQQRRANDPAGTLVKITPTVGPSLISLYNLRPTATIIGLPAQGVSSGQALTLMEEIVRRTLPPGTGFEWSAMSYQEKLVGGQMYIVFTLALLLVYLVLAGQYE